MGQLIRFLSMVFILKGKNIIKTIVLVSILRFLNKPISINNKHFYWHLFLKLIWAVVNFFLKQAMR